MMPPPLPPLPSSSRHRCCDHCFGGSFRSAVHAKSRHHFSLVLSPRLASSFLVFIHPPPGTSPPTTTPPPSRPPLIRQPHANRLVWPSFSSPLLSSLPPVAATIIVIVFVVASSVDKQRCQLGHHDRSVLAGIPVYLHCHQAIPARTVDVDCLGEDRRALP